MNKYKFKDWTIHSDGSTPVTTKEKEARAEEIAEELSNNNKWKSHGRPIGIDILRNELKLKISDFCEDDELNQIIYDYYDSLSEYINTHKFTVFIQTRLYI